MMMNPTINTTEILDPSASASASAFAFAYACGSKEYYEKNRITKQKYMKKVVNPAYPDGFGVTKKQELSARRRDIKHEQTNHNQYHNRTSKIKEKMFCAQDKIDLDQDFEDELRINQLVLDEIEAEEIFKAQEKSHKVQEELAKIWFERLLAKSKEDTNYENFLESNIFDFIEKNVVDPEQKAIADESFRRLLQSVKRDEDDNDDEDEDDYWYTGYW
jgi:hypothetical protein